VTSVFLRVAKQHFSTTLRAQNQPHTITLHLEFVRRTQAGPATLVVQDTKIGRQTSTIHISLRQDDGRDLVVGYLTNSNMDTEAGPSVDTRWALHPPAPIADLGALKRSASGDDGVWREVVDKPFPKFRRIMNHVHQYLPQRGQAGTAAYPATCDQWLRFNTGERFTDESVGLVSDLWPQVIEGMISAGQVDRPKLAFWYPTVVLNLDIKKRLPTEGAEWLFVRVAAKRIRNGREDLEVVIMDEDGDVVALSHHVALVLSSERNLAKRGGGGSGGEGKL
jgi:hypothetical protein